MKTASRSGHSINEGGSLQQALKMHVVQESACSSCLKATLCYPCGVGVGSILTSMRGEGPSWLNRTMEMLMCGCCCAQLSCLTCKECGWLGCDSNDCAQNCMRFCAVLTCCTANAILFEERRAAHPEEPGCYSAMVSVVCPCCTAYQLLRAEKHAEPRGLFINSMGYGNGPTAHG